MLATKPLFEQETWLDGWCLCVPFLFLRAGNGEIQITAKNLFCAACELCKCVSVFLAVRAEVGYSTLVCNY